MFIRILSVLLLVFAFVVSGCTEQSNESAFPNPGFLGEEFGTFEPPSEPVERAEVPAIAEPTGIITLRGALALALMHNPELKAFSWDVRVSQARQLQAGLWPNPTLEVEVQEVGGPGGRSDFDAAETTIALSQLIEMGGKNAKRVKVASLGNKLAGMDYESKRLDVFTEVTRAFIDVLAGQQRLTLTEELLGLSKELLDTVTKRVDAGKDSPLEKTKAAVACSNVKIKHRQAAGDLEFARKQLASTWSGQVPVFERVEGRLDLLTELPSVDALTGLLEQNPDIARWSLEVEKGKASLDLEKAKGVSDITLSGGMQRFNETDDNAVVFGISVPLPISDRNQAGKLEAGYKLSRAREKQKAAQNRIQMELVKAYQGLCNSYTEARELNENVLQGAESVFKASMTGYSQGKLDYLYVLDAQRTLFEAKSQYINALASFHNSKTDVERLIGTSIESVNVSNNEESK